MDENHNTAVAQPTAPAFLSSVLASSRVEIQVAPMSAVIPRHYSETPDAEWTWEHLRDYCVDQIILAHGKFPRIPVRENATFQRFAKDWGTDAPKIARYAFEVCGGRWAGAPIAVSRFCRGSDDFFARPIVDRIRQVA